MARTPSPPWIAPVWSRRVTEWGLVLLVLVGLLWGLEHEASVVRGRAEMVAVRATLASLRAALVMDQLLSHAGKSVPTDGRITKNPFTLLQVVPPNYAGSYAMREIDAVSSGSWVFDAECGCVGYRLLYPQWLEPAQTGDAIWFRVGLPDAGASLVALDQYRWFGQVLK